MKINPFNTDLIPSIVGLASQLMLLFRCGFFTQS